LMDIQMPVMDGYEATRRIRMDSRFAELPIIAVTAHAYLEEQQQCQEAGMNDHIVKPLNSKIMFSTIEKWRRKDRNTQLKAETGGLDKQRLQEIFSCLQHYIMEQDGQAAYFLQDCRHELEIFPESALASLENLLSSYDYDAALDILPRIAGILDISLPDHALRNTL